MDIDLLSKMVKELILDHDRVSLPGLGTFVAEMVPASFTDKGYTINPPYRRLSFRQTEGEDSLLVSWYASLNGVSEEVASSAIEDFMAGLKEVLEKRKNVIFPGLGRLRATKENNLFFIADEDLDIYPEGFGLSPVSLKTHVETKEEVSAALGSLKDIIEIQRVPEYESIPGDESADSPGESAGENVEMSAAELSEKSEPEAGGGTEVPEVADPDGADSDVVEEVGTVPGTAVPEEAVQTQTDGPSPDTVPAVETVPPEEKQPCDVKPEVREKGHRKNKGLYIVLIIIASAVLLVVLYMAVARIFPEAVDGLLYNHDEYELLHGSGK